MQRPCQVKKKACPKHNEKGAGPPLLVRSPGSLNSAIIFPIAAAVTRAALIAAGAIAAIAAVAAVAMGSVAVTIIIEERGRQKRCAPQKIAVMMVTAVVMVTTMMVVTMMASPHEGDAIVSRRSGGCYGRRRAASRCRGNAQRTGHRQRDAGGQHDQTPLDANHYCFSHNEEQNVPFAWIRWIVRNLSKWLRSE